MIQADFIKLTKGSIVCFSLCNWFHGVVLAKLFFDRDGKGERNCVYVDFHPNTSTGGYDPSPAWYDASSLSIISYADGGNSETNQNIPIALLDAIQKSINNMTDDLIILNKKMDELRKL